MSALAETIMSLRPALYYPFREKSGTFCRDHSGNERHGTYKNAPGLGKPGLPYFEPGLSALELNGTNQYVDSGWLTRTNLLSDPDFEATVADWFLSASGWTGATREREAAPAAMAALGSSWAMRVKGTHEASVTNRFLIAESATGVSGCPVKAGSTYVFAPYVLMVDAPAGIGGTNLGVEIRWWTAAGVEIPPVTGTNYNIGVGELARPSVIAVAPAEAAFADARVVARSNVSGDTVDFWIDSCLFEQATSLGSYFPTPSQLASGEAGWSGAEHASASDIGPFARGTVRTFVGLAERTADLDEDALFGSSVERPLTYIIKGGSISYFDTGSSGNLGVWPGLNQPVAWAMVDNRGAGTAEMFLNGASQGQKAVAGTYPSPGGSLQIGTWFSGGSAFGGKVDEFAVFTRALTEAEIRTLAKAMLPGIH